MSHIFISYSHKDKNYVEKLEQKLIEEGFNVWIDHRIDCGSQWPKVIQNALDACDAFIVVVTENAFESEWVLKMKLPALNVRTSLSFHSSLAAIHLPWRGERRGLKSCLISWKPYGLIA